MGRYSINLSLGHTYYEYCLHERLQASTPSNHTLIDMLSHTTLSEASQGVTYEAHGTLGGPS